MKKMLAILMALSMTLGLCACHNFIDDEKKTPVPSHDVTVNYSYTDEQQTDENGRVIFTQAVGTAEVRSKDTHTAERINASLAELYVRFRDDSLYTQRVAADQTTGKPVELGYYVTAASPRCDVRVLSLTFDVLQDLGGVHADSYRLSRSFNADTGALLTLGDIAKNEEQLKTFIKNYVIGLMAGDEYLLKDGQSYLFDDAQSVIGTIVDDGQNWYFSDKGLVVYANPYDIAPYVYGVMSFDIPYAALEEFISADFMPVAYEGENGIVLGDAGGTIDPETVNILDTITVDPDMQSVILSAEETVYNVRIYTAERTLWQRNYLTTGEGVEVISSIPDVLPNIGVYYQLADGTEVTRGIYQSGKDGSIILSEITEEEPLFIPINQAK